MDQELASAPVVLPLVPVVTGVLLVYAGQFAYSLFQVVRRNFPARPEPAVYGRR
jgi:hypothetical protein